MVLVWAIPASLGAQSRATLQVAAQVVFTGPSQEALAQVLPSLTQTGPETRPTLATIRVDRVLAPATPDSVARRPRTVVTIAFLSN